MQRLGRSTGPLVWAAPPGCSIGPLVWVAPPGCSIGPLGLGRSPRPLLRAAPPGRSPGPLLVGLADTDRMDLRDSLEERKRVILEVLKT